MASIVVAGDTSGTITLAAPAVSGTTTLTLPTTSGTVLTSASTITPSAGTVNQAALATGVAGTGPAFSAYSSNQSFSTGVWTKLACSNETFDTNSNYDNATNYRFTPTVAGYYQLNGNLAIAGTSGICVAAFWKNGGLAISGSQSALNSNYSISNANSVIYMNGSTDYVELYGIQISGSTQTSITSTGPYNFFNGALIRAA